MKLQEIRIVLQFDKRQSEIWRDFFDFQRTYSVNRYITQNLLLSTCSMKNFTKHFSDNQRGKQFGSHKSLIIVKSFVLLSVAIVFIMLWQENGRIYIDKLSINTKSLLYTGLGIL